jgi:hypothetical protein
LADDVEAVFGGHFGGQAEIGESVGARAGGAGQGDSLGEGPLVDVVEANFDEFGGEFFAANLPGLTPYCRSNTLYTDMFCRCARSAAFFAVVVFWASVREPVRAPLPENWTGWSETSEVSGDDKHHPSDFAALGSPSSTDVDEFHRVLIDSVPPIRKRTLVQTLPVRGPPLG